MLRSSRSSVFEDRLARISGSAPAGRSFTSRSKIALTAGLILATALTILLGPNLGAVFAFSDDHASFWRAEKARENAMRQRAAAAQPQRQTRAQARQQRQTRQQQPPRQMSAYAPMPQRLAQPLPDPFWFLGQNSRLGDPSVNTTNRAQPRNAKRAKASFRPQSRNATSRFVCVRLCDGYFFPAPLGLGVTEAGCASACPDAPTRLFSMRSDNISDAVSVRGGAPYAKLPVALLYTRVREQTCSCGAPDPSTTIMSDASLRRGDRFMTENGFQIYQGNRGRQISRRDFKSIAQTRGLPRRERNLLLAIERVSLPRPAERLAAARPATMARMGATHVALGAPSAPRMIALR